jgi:hypothetical protein
VVGEAANHGRSCGSSDACRFQSFAGGPNMSLTNGVASVFAILFTSGYLVIAQGA